MNNMNNEMVKGYEENYNDKSLINKVKRFGTKMGSKLVYMVLILYYTLISPSVPAKIKTTIVGALGYVIAPIDLIFDGIPVAGYTDDLSAVMAAFVIIGFYVTPEIKQQAREKMMDIFGEKIVTDLDAIEVELNETMNKNN